MGRWTLCSIDPFLARVLSKVRLRDGELRMCCALAQTTTYIRSSKFQEPRTVQVEGVWGVAPSAALSASAVPRHHTRVVPRSNHELARGLRSSRSGTLRAGGRTKSYLACYIRLEKSDGWCRHMANLQGYSTAAVGNMLNHYTRHGHDRDQTRYTYANQSIDPARTHMNYAIFEREDPRAFVQAFVKAADVPPRGYGGPRAKRRPRAGRGRTPGGTTSCARPSA